MGIKRLWNKLANVESYLDDLADRHGVHVRHWILWVVFIVGTVLLGFAAEFIDSLIR